MHAVHEFMGLKLNTNVHTIISFEVVRIENLKGMCAVKVIHNYIGTKFSMELIVD